MRYRATVNCNHRSIWKNGDYTPVVMLTHILDENNNELRKDNHTWVSKEELKGYIPKDNAYLIDIEFNADVRTYLGIDNKTYRQIEKYKWDNVRNIRFLRNYKKLKDKK